MQPGQAPATDIQALTNKERTGLADLLDGLTEAEWQRPSLCAGWRVRDVVAHLLMPYELSPVGFVAMMARHRFDFNRAADARARNDTRTHSQLVKALRATEFKKFASAAAEAPLTHLVIHSLDITYPLGRRGIVPAAAATIVLEQLGTGAGSKLRRPGLLDGLSLVATDADWRSGAGVTVTGSAAALILILAGRPAGIDDLAGDGVDELRARWTPRVQ